MVDYRTAHMAECDDGFIPRDVGIKRRIAVEEQRPEAERAGVIGERSLEVPDEYIWNSLFQHQPVSLSRSNCRGPDPARGSTSAAGAGPNGGGWSVHFGLYLRRDHTGTRAGKPREEIACRAATFHQFGRGGAPRDRELPRRLRNNRPLWPPRHPIGPTAGGCVRRGNGGQPAPGKNLLAR
jgi:hypothetical protein